MIERVADVGVAGRGDQPTGGWDQLGKGLEGLNDVGEAVVYVEVIRIDVSYDRHRRAKVVERAVVLARLGDEGVPLAGGRSAPKLWDRAADDPRRLEVQLGEDKRGHRGGGGLAVRPGDRDAAAFAHDGGEQLGVLHDRQVKLNGPDELGVVVLDRGRPDDEVDIRSQRLAGLLVNDLRAPLHELEGGVVGFGFGTGDDRAGVEQDAGKARHA